MEKLQLYALFKQATKGPPNPNPPDKGTIEITKFNRLKCTDKGRTFSDADPIAYSKWQAWNEVRNLERNRALEEYVKFADELSEKAEPTQGVSTSMCPGFEVEVENGVRTIALSRPGKFNAISGDMYMGLPKLFEAADADDSTRVIVLTGRGKYYSSGNDLSSFKLDRPISEMAPIWSATLLEFVKGFIDVKKPIIAAVNGPAIGIACTTLGLCDVVIASDSSTFNTPFMKLAQTPEGCASFTFPRIFGVALANEILMDERKLSAEEARDFGLVSTLVPAAEFESVVKKRAAAMASYPPETLVKTKKLIRSPIRAQLHAANEAECALLTERWSSAECMNAMMNFFTSRRKK